MLLEGDAVPAPSRLSAIMADPANADGMPVVITPSLPRQAPAVRLDVTLEEHIGADIEERAKRLGDTRS
jgi:hypothetical protein